MTTCPSCGEENPERARFCLACGTPLQAPAPQAEERKIVTVLFCDLVGFTARSDRADPEDVRAALRPYHARVRKEIERFGGTVEKFIGDAVMAVFGAPVAHEDDAERAVRAALRIPETIAELNRETPDLDLAVRIGINTGEAVVALGARPEEGEGIVTGDVVNTASRLQGSAPVGGILVGEITYRATRDLIDYEALKPVQVKGKAEPVPVWRAVSARSRYGVDVERVRTPFVGRDGDLALLKHTFARVVRESGVQLVTVVGEPGVGKTRLVGEFFEFIDELPDIVYWRQGRCLPYGEGVTFWALGEIVKAHAGILESDTPEVASRKLARSVGALEQDPSDADWLVARLSPLVGGAQTAGTAEREESFTAWRKFLEAIASTRPLMVIVEDLHWADDAMLEFAEYLVDWSTEVPLLVICSARPELYERRPDWGGGKRNSTTISLSPLTDEDTAALISALLSETKLPAETQAALLERAGGNPLYAEEFVRMITDRGILERRGGEVRIDPDAEFELPDSVQALIAARLDTLPTERKSLLQDAAVVGKVFWSGAVATMGDIEEGAARDRLHELAKKELVRPARISSVKDQDEYSFWHLLVRDVAYAQIPRAARVNKHRAAAAWIEGIAGDRVEDHAELLAHHYTEALKLSRTAGADGAVAELEVAASRFLVMAGDRAVRLDVGTAETYYRRAIELLPQDHPDRAAALAKAGEAAYQAGRFPEAEQDCHMAIQAYRAQGDALGAGKVLATLAGICWYRGDTAQAHTYATEAVQLLESLPPGRELVEATIRLSNGHLLAGRAQEALDWCERALALAEELGIHDEAVTARAYLGSARCDLGDPRGLEDQREALKLGLELGLGDSTGRTYNNLAYSVWQFEGPAQALELQRAGIEFSERRGLTRQVLWTTAEMLETLYDLGRWDELLSMSDDLVERDRARGGSQLEVIAFTLQAYVTFWRGQIDKAASLVKEFLGKSREIGDPQVLAPALAVSALVAHGRGGSSSAVELVGEFEDATKHAPTFRALFLPDAVRAATQAKALDVARRLLIGLDTAAARQRNNILTSRAILAEAEDRPEEASTLYADATGRWKEFGFVLEQGHSFFGAGRCLVALGRPADAAPELEVAREIFVGLGANPLIEETERLLERARA